MEIVRAQINNILSIEELSIDFESTGLVLVDGWNSDDNRANGAGKSAIFNAVSFALFDKVPRKITKTEILRKGTKIGYAYVEVKIGPDTYAVKRFRPTNTEYYINGVKSDITQEEFEFKIGFNYDQFMITMYTAQNTNNKFIFLNDRGKKDFILQLMKLSTFNDFHNIAKDKVSELDILINSLNNQLGNLQSQVAIYKESMINEKATEAVIEDHNQHIDEYAANIKKLQDIVRPDVSKYIQLENNISAANNNLMLVQKNRDEALVEYQHNKAIAESPFIFNKPNPDTECPECSTPLVIHGKSLMHIKDIKAQEEAAKLSHELTIKEAKDNMIEVLNKIKQYDDKLSERNKINELEKKLIEQKKKDFRDYDDAQGQISEYQRCISSRQQSIAHLEEKLANNKIVLEKVKTIVSEATVIKQKMTQYQEELEVVKQCAQVFASTGAPAYIMDNIVEMFNETVSDYIQMIWPSASYKLNTYKTKTDKNVVAKFSEELIIGGKTCSIGSLSGGELRSLSLALDFAILDVLTSQYGNTINPIVLDEPFDGLDVAGREIVIDLLNKISNKHQIIVIDHMTESKALFSKVIRVEKKNGITRIIETES